MTSALLCLHLLLVNSPVVHTDIHHGRSDSLKQSALQEKEMLLNYEPKLDQKIWQLGCISWRVSFDIVHIHPPAS